MATGRGVLHAGEFLPGSPCLTQGLSPQTPTAPTFRGKAASGLLNTPPAIPSGAAFQQWDTLCFFPWETLALPIPFLRDRGRGQACGALALTAFEKHSLPFL